MEGYTFKAFYVSIRVHSICTAFPRRSYIKYWKRYTAIYVRPLKNVFKTDIVRETYVLYRPTEVLFESKTAARRKPSCTFKYNTLNKQRDRRVQINIYILSVTSKRVNFFYYTKKRRVSPRFLDRKRVFNKQTRNERSKKKKNACRNTETKSERNRVTEANVTCVHAYVREIGNACGEWQQWGKRTKR